jgi:hypothetical protein
MFEADNSWRCIRSDVFQAIFPEQGIQRYRLIEISLNVQIFHVDILVEHGGELYWSRYLFDAFHDVLRFVTDDGVVECRISIQSCRSDSGNYSIKKIDRVFELIDYPGAYFFETSERIFLRDSLHEFSSEKSKLVLVWSSDRN